MSSERRHLPQWATAASAALALAGSAFAIGTAQADPSGAEQAEGSSTAQVELSSAAQVERSGATQTNRSGAAQAERSGAIEASRVAPVNAHSARSLSVNAHASRSLSVNDTGHLHLLKAFGSVLLEEGSAGGTLPGKAKVRLVVGSTVTASFTIRTANGTIYGSGRAALHSSGRYASFGGSLSVSHGSGRYARAHGKGKLYGVIDRRTSALTVQTVGTLSY